MKTAVGKRKKNRESEKKEGNTSKEIERENEN